MALNEKLGAIRLPLDASAVSVSISIVADPARDILLDLFRVGIVSECQAAFDVAKIGTKLSGSVVDGYLAFNPEPALGLGIQFGFPLLALWRQKSTIQERTMWSQERATEWGLMYILGEMTPQEMGKLYPLLSAVEATVMAVAETGRHPDANDGYCILDAAGLHELGFTESTYGHWAAEGDSKLIIPAITMTLRTAERYADDGTYPALTGARITINVTDDAGTVDDLIVVDTDNYHEANE